MILRLFTRTPQGASINALYGMIVAQARSPEFYRHYGVPDTLNGRFEMLALHTVLLLRRLMRAPPLRDLGQEIFDRFCDDMDDTMREMGVGDLAVPKKMHRVGAAFYQRQSEYHEALEGEPTALATVLTRNLLGGGEPIPGAGERLARYVRSADELLSAQDDSVLAGGAIRFPDPAQVPGLQGA